MQRRGALLLELVLVLLVAGLVVGIAMPAFRRPLDRLAADRAAIDVAAAHTRARIASVAHNRVSRLVITPDSLIITLGHPPDTTRFWTGVGPRASSVTLAGPARPITFRPAGISFGLSNSTYSLTRGNARTDVIVSRLGRVRMVRR
jgi:Tfp pilus assembly protein FimT